MSGSLTRLESFVAALIVRVLSIPFFLPNLRRRKSDTILEKMSNTAKLTSSFNTISKKDVLETSRKIIYLPHTRQDTACAMNMVSQFIHSMREVHLHAIYKVNPGK